MKGCAVQLQKGMFSFDPNFHIMGMMTTTLPKEDSLVQLYDILVNKNRAKHHEEEVIMR